MIASVVAVILESTMNFKLIRKTERGCPRRGERNGDTKYEGGSYLFEITTDHYEQSFGFRFLLTSYLGRSKWDIHLS